MSQLSCRNRVDIARIGLSATYWYFTDFVSILFVEWEFKGPLSHGKRADLTRLLCQSFSLFVMLPCSLGHIESVPPKTQPNFVRQVLLFQQAIIGDMRTLVA